MIALGGGGLLTDNELHYPTIPSYSVQNKFSLIDSKELISFEIILMSVCIFCIMHTATF
jgi:hypothetical protein